MLHAVVLIPLLPLIGAFILAIFGRKIGEPKAGWFATLCVFGSFVAAVVTYIGLLGSTGISRSFDENLFTWMNVGTFHVNVGFLADPLSLTMALFVTGVSALIHLYSIEYMHTDKDFPKFFMYLNLFVSSMLVLVLGSSLLMTFVGWEGVGVCSYFLISFWFERPSAASAGKKAMIVNRIADVGFILAMFLCVKSFGSLDYKVIFSSTNLATKGTITAIVLLAFLGAMGKSAQFPLFGWLADAMEGPTPVSALIHAATMVTAGVFLMVRLNPLLELSPDASHVIAVVGIITAFVAAAAGTSQDDIKKVLAYSTVSQLGYMFIGVGTGDYVGAIFLMVTHAFYKALLFLSSGSVIHGMNDEQNLKLMGALRKLMPVTAAAFFVGWMAIAGVPPFAGFWSKGDVLLHAFEESPLLWFFGVATAGLTSYYMGREYSLAFLGDERWKHMASKKAKKKAKKLEISLDKHVPHPHDPTYKMLFPLQGLAVLAILGGVLNLPFASSLHVLEHFLAPVIGSNLPHYKVASGTVQWVLGIVDAVVAVGGGFLAYRIWSKDAFNPNLEPDFLANAWYLDKSLDVLVAKSGTKVASFSATVVDPKIIDGSVRGIAVATLAVGRGFRKLASGFVRREALVIAGGTVALIILAGIRGGW